MEIRHEEISLMAVPVRVEKLFPLLFKFDEGGREAAPPRLMAATGFFQKSLA
jgi:hypothetical protein